MKPPPLRYSRPGSTAEALATLASLGEHGKVLAGGQSLVPLLSMRLAAPENLVEHQPARRARLRPGGGRPGPGGCAGAARTGAGRPGRGHRPAAAGEGAAVRRPRGHPQPGHHRRQHRARRPGGGDAHGAGLAGRGGAGGSPGRGAARPRQRVLPRAAGVGGAAGGTRHRGPLPGAGAVRGHRVRRGEQAARRLRGVRSGRHHPAGRGRPDRRGAGYLSVGPTPLVLDLTEAAAADGTDGFSAAADLARQQVNPEPDIHATAAYRRHLAGVLTQRALLEALGEAQVRETAPGGETPGGAAPGGTAGD